MPNEALPLPYSLGDQEDPVQGNFDFLRRQFPLGRRHMKIESPHVVGAAGEPAFQNSWVNFDTNTYHGARFWKDPMGVVHVEGAVKSGTIATTIFSLPAGYRPGVSGVPPVAAVTNTGFGEVNIAPTGNVVAQSGGNGRFSFSIHFKQES